MALRALSRAAACGGVQRARRARAMSGGGPSQWARVEAEVRSRLSEAGECDTEIEVISRELVLFARRSGNGWEAVLDDAVRRRIEDREPLQYIIGEWDFHELRGLAVRKPCLCPRPETEELVSRLVASVDPTPAHGDDTFRVLDVGSGSGALGLALLHQWQDAELVAIDVSDDACALTVENAVRFGFDDRTTVINTSIHEFATNNTPNNYFDPNNSFHLIVSNPPYIPTSQMLGLDPVVSRHEDPRALDGGLDGMDVIRQIIQFAPYLAAPGAHMWLEVDSSHPELLAREAPIGSAVELIASFTDMAKHPRFVQLRVHGSDD